jgi:Ycf66 protein N-terminus
MIGVWLNSAMILGQVNIGMNSASLLGIFLAVAGVALYFLRTVRPELSRDYDIFFSAAGILCGGILLFYGWLLEPVLQFQHLMLAGSTVFFAVEAIRLRGITNEQARRNSPVMDRERPVSRTQVYQDYPESDADRIESYEAEPQYNNPRLEGYPESGTSRRGGYEAQDSGIQRNRASLDKYGYSEPNRKRRSRSNAPLPEDRNRDRSRSGDYTDRTPRTENRYQAWEENVDTWEEGSSYSVRPRRSPSENRNAPKSSRPNSKRRPPRPSDTQRASEGYLEPTSSDYVDYQPIDRQNNLGNGTPYED